MTAEAGDAARFEIDGLRCRIVHVDGLLPNHDSAPGSQRLRHRFVPGEVAHFAIGGRMYALVVDDAAAVRPRAPSDMVDMLTSRELQIVQLICNGLLTKQVSARLRISEFTVRSYLKTIYCKLGVRSRAAMVYAYAQAIAQRLPGTGDHGAP